MKKLLVLMSTVLMAGCFICHKTTPQEQQITIVEIAQQQSPVQEEKVISRHSVTEVANFAFDSKEVQSDHTKMISLMKDIQAHPDAS